MLIRNIQVSNYELIYFPPVFNKGINFISIIHLLKINKAYEIITQRILS